MIVFLNILTCVLAIAMVAYALIGVKRTENSHRSTLPYILPSFVGMAYIITAGINVYDYLSRGEDANAVYAVHQLMQTLLILAVIILLYRSLQNRRDCVCDANR